MNSLNAEIADFEVQYKMKKKMANMLVGGQKNIEKLEAHCAQLELRVDDLKKEWDKQKLALLDTINSKNAVYKLRKVRVLSCAILH